MKEAMQVPPGFYDEDVENWTKKFQTARDTRQLEKTRIKSMGCFKPVGTKNYNTANPSKPKRRNSRQSTATYTGIDFDYTGNTNNVHHLIKNTSTNPNRHKANLNFELNLRTYKNTAKFVGQQAWEYPQAKRYYDPV